MKEFLHFSPFLYKMLISSFAIALCLISIAYFVFVPISNVSGLSSSGSPLPSKEKSREIVVPACQLYQHSVEKNGSGIISPQRLVVVGDVHGSFDGLLEILFRANIINSPSDCTWKEDISVPTTLIQVGDIVDRGEGASEAWKCLQYLQNTTAPDHKVIRLLGNHDIWWLQGHFHMRNTIADTLPKIQDIVAAMQRDIMRKKLLLGYIHRIQNVPILFTHAGFHSEFLNYLQSTIGSMSPEDISSYLNGVLVDATSICISDSKCDFSDQIFEAGKDRGGRGIGGPLWTDFRTILNDFNKKNFVPPRFIQVVGHTASRCGMDPDEANCIRHSPALAAVCVDGGMYYGSRSFLEIGLDGRFRSFQKSFTSNEWQTDDLSELVCKYSTVEITV